MSNFLERIEKALDESQMTRYPQVNPRDLRDLLRHFKSMDAKERMHYPPHVEMLVASAVRVHDECLMFVNAPVVNKLREALDYAKPGWRTK